MLSSLVCRVTVLSLRVLSFEGRDSRPSRAAGTVPQSGSHHLSTWVKGRKGRVPAFLRNPLWHLNRAACATLQVRIKEADRLTLALGQ